MAIKYLCLLLLCQYSFAASYYVSSAGNDSNNGTTTGTPWLTFSNVNRTTFNAGDSVLLRAGDTFDGPLFITNAGTVGSPIIIDSYGAGARPIVRGDHPSSVWGAAVGFAGFYTNVPLTTLANIQLVYDSAGFKYGEMPNRLATSYAAWLGAFTNGSWGQDNQTRVYYLKTTDGNIPSNMHLFDFRSVWASSNYAIIRGLEVANSGDAISVGGLGCCVSNNLIHDCFGAGIKLEGAWKSEVVSNTIQQSGWTMIYMIQPGGSNYVHHNLLITNSTTICGNVFLNASELNGFGLLGGTNNLIERNTILYMDDSFFDFFYEANTEIRFNYCFHGAVGSPGGTGLSLHHNIFDGDNSGGGVIGSHYWSPANQIPSDTGPVRIFNNTFNNFQGDGIYVVGTNATNVILRNNIFSTSSSYAGGSMGVYESGVDSDYNSFYSTGISPRWQWNGSFSSTLAAFYTASGQEQHSIYTNALFIIASPVSPLGFQLQPTSPCINAGVLYVTGGTDWNGLSVPQGLAPDMGAFEFAFSPMVISGRTTLQGQVLIR